MNNQIIVLMPDKKTETIYSNAGVGKYPHECAAKNKYPNSEIFISTASGHWLASHNLVEIKPNLFTSKYWL